MGKFMIIVEGEADKKFFWDYFHHLFGEQAPKDSIIHSGKDSDTGGYTKLKSEEALQAMRKRMRTIYTTALAALALMHTSSAKTMIAYLDVFIVVKRIYFSMSSSSMVKVRALKGLMLPMSCVP